MVLKMPLTQNQIDAARRLHERLDQWRLSDAALRRLHETFSGFEIEACVLKSVAINALYGTQVFAIVRMAQHVETIFRRTETAMIGVDLVELIAALPQTSKTTVRRFVS